MSDAVVEKIENGRETVAKRAIDLAAQHGLSPSPQTYEVFYMYAEGRSPALTARIDALTEISAEHIEELHGEFCASEQQTEVSKLISLNQKVAETFRALDGDVGDSIKQSVEAEGALANLTEQMQSNPQQVSDFVKLVAEVVESEVKRSQSLREKLEKTREETDVLLAEIDELRNAANQDPFTHLANRRVFDTKLAELVERPSEENLPACLIVADIDNMTSINETFGHAMGDEVIRKFSTIIERNMRSRDLAARIGGGEFAMILTAMSSHGGQVVANRMRQYLMSLRMLDPVRNARIERVTASFGVAELQRGDTVDTLYERAEKQLAEAKTNGRNKVSG